MINTVGRVLYYSHSKRKYNTPREQKEISLILKHFPKAVVYNPNNWGIRNSNSPMDRCLQIIEFEITAGVIFSTYLDCVGRGVYKEIQKALEINKFVGMIKKNSIIPFTKMYLKVINIDWAIKYAIIKSERR